MSAVEQQPERLHALDAVRGFALLLGVVFHATLSFLPSQQPMWMIMDVERSASLGVTFFVLHMFRMTTFFLIAGFFAHLVYHRRGEKAFIKDRLKRIGIPLVAFWPIVMAAIIAASIWAVIVMNGELPKTPPPPPPGPKPAIPFPLTHLWFLYVLLIFYAFTLLGRRILVAMDGQGRLRAGVDKLLAWVVGNPILSLLLAVPVFAALAVQPNWRMWTGVPTPDSSLIPNLSAFVGYGVAFTFGWLLHRQADLIRVWERRWAFNLVLAISFTVGAIYLVGVEPTGRLATPDDPRVAYAACYALACWTWTFALIGLALKFLSDHSPVRRYIADASYWIYIIHLPLVIVLQVAVSQIPWPAELKFVLVLAIAFPLMFASYQVMVRYTWLGGLLNGARKPKPAKAAKGGVAVQAETP